MGKKLLTSKELALELNVSPAAISKAISTGRIRESIVERTKEGYLIDLEEAKYEWQFNRQRQPANSPVNDPLAKYELEAVDSWEYPTQQESIQRKENAMAEIASMRLESLTKDRYELSFIEKTIMENIPQEQRILAKRVINEFRKNIVKKYRR